MSIDALGHELAAIEAAADPEWALIHALIRMQAQPDRALPVALFEAVLARRALSNYWSFYNGALAYDAAGLGSTAAAVGALASHMEPASPGAAYLNGVVHRHFIAGGNAAAAAGIRARHRAQFGAAPLGRVTKVVSLGEACDTAHQIRRVLGQAEAYPFDWLITPHDSLNELLANDFAGFLDTANLVLGPEEALETRYRVRLLHDFAEADRSTPAAVSAVQAKYLRRIDRLRALLASGGPVLFVRGQQYNDDAVFGPAKARALIATIRRAWPELEFRLLVQNPTPSGLEEIDTPELAMFRLDPPVPQRWEGDDAQWAALFRRAGVG